MTTAEQLEARGQAKGRAEGRAEMLVRLLTRKFGPLPDAAQTKITTASVQRLDEWADRLLTATTLDEIFG